MINDTGSLNNHEGEFLSDQLHQHGLENKKMHYHKIWAVAEGKRFQSKIKSYLNNDLLAIVVNFVDQLAHRRSESDVLKEMVPDEAGYRQAVRSWYKKSWIRQVLHELSYEGFNVIITSDHGSIMVNDSAIVAADKNSSSGIRYKYGININSSEKKAIDIRNLKDYRLPILEERTNYLIAKDNFFFLYPNEQRKYKKLLENSFQHGGISIEEMLIPIFTMKPK
jgi:PglZ domain.